MTSALVFAALAIGSGCSWKPSSARLPAVIEDLVPDSLWRQGGAAVAGSRAAGDGASPAVCPSTNQVALAGIVSCSRPASPSTMKPDSTT